MDVRNYNKTFFYIYFDMSYYVFRNAIFWLKSFVDFCFLKF